MSRVSIWLDDERPAPLHWIHVKTASDCIVMLEEFRGHVDAVSFDHDLGLEHETGYDALLWLEEQVIMNDYPPLEINIHTANLGAKIKMLQAAENIRKFHERSGV